MPLTADLVAFLTKATESKEAHDHRLYDKKLTEEGHRLETLIRNALADNNHDRIARIVHQLCHDYAYAVHTPHARNGGLIGLAAAGIALGSVWTTSNSWAPQETDISRKSHVTLRKSFHQFWPASPTTTHESGITLANRCTT